MAGLLWSWVLLSMGLLGQRRRISQLVSQCALDSAQLGGDRRRHLQQAGLVHRPTVAGRLLAGRASKDGRIPLLLLLLLRSRQLPLPLLRLLQ